MGRISRDEMLMEMACAVAKRGTCSRKQVGVVVAREGRVLVTGYNGAPAGMPHCGHEVIKGWELVERGGHWKTTLGVGPFPDHLLEDDYWVTQWGDKLVVTNSLRTCPASVHAEANAVAFAAHYGIRLAGADLFTTWSPCNACAQLIINAGIHRVVMQEMYHDTAGWELLVSAGVEALLIP